MHIVVFPGWYPGRADKLSGDFIQRHMQAISLHCNVSVVIPVKDANIRKKEEQVTTKAKLLEWYIYYPSFSSLQWLDNLVSFTRYNYYCLKAFRALLRKGKIDLVHIYVLQKNTLIGYLLQQLYSIRYVISEQSTAYVNGDLEASSRVKRKMVQFAFRQALDFHAVSNFLLRSLTDKMKLTQPGLVIPNVVDAELFFPVTTNSNTVTTFVHVSNLVYQKNVEGMLHAFALVKKRGKNFRLNLVGPSRVEVMQMIRVLDLKEEIQVWNERNYSEVAEIMQQSDAFVFFTRYETFGCVIIEANACGLPVIVSDLEVTRELINQQNGLFAKSEDVADLAAKIEQVIDAPDAFERFAISQQTRTRFNFEKVGLQFINWYTTALNRQVSK